MTDGMVLTLAIENLQLIDVFLLNSWDPIVKYIKDQHSAYLRKELTAQRERYIQDTRIHCCLFFIQPSGHAYVKEPQKKVFRTPVLTFNV
jgi:septin family protein